jgi:molecular chaperone DnaK
MESNDPDAIKSAQEELTRSSHKLAEAMYAKASQKGAAEPGAEAGPQEGPRQKAQEDVVDADFEDVGKK